MLSDVVFPPELPKAQYKAERDRLKERLMVLQQHAACAGMGTVVVFEGWGAAGKGSRISDLVVDLDARAYAVHTVEEPVGHESRLPFMTRYWKRLGRRGTMTIFDQAYYDELSRSYVQDVLLRGGPGREGAVREAAVRSAKERLAGQIRSVRAFERQLEADGFLIVTFFLHISREMQSERIMALMCDSASSWKVDEADIRQIQHYDEYREVFDSWLGGELDDARWCIVAAQHRRNANVEILRHLVDCMDAALRARGVDTSLPVGEGLPKAKPASADDDAADALQIADKNTGDASGLVSRFDLKRVKTLEEARRSRRSYSSDEEYREDLKREQAKLGSLALEMYRHRIPLVVAYEGWDAAGKGGNIKRLASAMDARNYRVHPVGPASSDELARPFLWRFWNALPRTGHAAIFDRTWYGRVLVERVEGFATRAEWERAYDEINEFEDDLRSWGAVLVKVWLDISPEEQLRRFEDRQNDPARRWKITPDDWRNREKNHLYRRCVDDMVRLTSTDCAPWHIVSSDDKRYARVKVLKIVNKALEERLQL